MANAAFTAYVAANQPLTDAEILANTAPVSTVGALSRATIKTYLAQAGELAPIMLSPSPVGQFVQRMFTDPDYTSFDLALSSLSGQAGVMAELLAAGLITQADITAITALATTVVDTYGSPVEGDVTAARAAITLQASVLAARSAAALRYQELVGALDAWGSGGPEVTLVGSFYSTGS
jgi:hypothetical protein